MGICSPPRPLPKRAGPQFVGLIGEMETACRQGSRENAITRSFAGSLTISDQPSSWGPGVQHHAQQRTWQFGPKTDRHLNHLYTPHTASRRNAETGPL